MKSSLGEVEMLNAIEQAETILLKKKVPVVEVEYLTDDQQKEFIIKDNGAWGEWDMENLANDWSDLPLEEWGVKGIEVAEVEPEKEKPKTDLLRLVFNFEEDVYNDVSEKLETACRKLGVDSIEDVLVELLKKF